MSHFRQWLNQPMSVGFPPCNDLDPYLIPMEQHGYDSIDYLASLTEGELEAMFVRVGITKIGHKDKLLKKITKARGDALLSPAGPLATVPRESITNAGNPTYKQVLLTPGEKVILLIGILFSAVVLHQLLTSRWSFFLASIYVIKERLIKRSKVFAKLFEAISSCYELLPTAEKGIHGRSIKLRPFPNGATPGG